MQFTLILYYYKCKIKTTMENKIYSLKYIFILVFLIYKINYSFAQIQTWIGFQTSDFRPSYLGKGISTGIIIKDKLLFKYSFTTRTIKNDYFVGKYSDEDIYNNHLLSIGWIFTKPYKKIRMGSGFSIIYFFHESSSYNNSILKYKTLSDGFATIPGLTSVPFPLPFFYMDIKVSNNLKIIFNTSIIMNEIGLGYRFGKPPIQPNVEEKLKKTNNKEKVIFH